MQHYPVIIIGAGVAGLTCAIYLKQKSIPFVLLESSDEVGGRVRTDRVDGFLLDRGFQIFLTSYPEAKRVLNYEALQLKAFRSGATIRQDNRFIQLVNPLKEPLSALPDLFSPVGSLLDKIKIVKLVAELGGKSNEEIFAQPATSTIDYLIKYGWSPRIIENFFKPFFGGVFLERELKTSSNFFQFVFKQFAVSDATLPSAGIQAIPDQLAAQLPAQSIRKGTRVRSVEGNKVYLANGERLQADSIVLAVDAGSAWDLQVPTQARGFNYTSCLYFAAPASPLDTPMLVINGNGESLINNMCVPSDIAPSYAPPGKSLISVSIVKPHTFTNEELTQSVVTELAGWYGDQVHQWKHLKTYHLPHALPSYTAKDSFEGLQLSGSVFRCGDYTAYPSLNGAMQTGRLVASMVEEKIAGLVAGK
jgi:phytoene dehydrogenase-like protein